MIVTVRYSLSDGYADDTRQAITDGDHSWILELLNDANLEQVVEGGHIVGTGAIAPRPEPPNFA